MKMVILIKFYVFILKMAFKYPKKITTLYAAFFIKIADFKTIHRNALILTPLAGLNVFFKNFKNINFVPLILDINSCEAKNSNNMGLVVGSLAIIAGVCITAKPFVQHYDSLQAAKKWWNSIPDHEKLSQVDLTPFQQNIKDKFIRNSITSDGWWDDGKNVNFFKPGSSTPYKHISSDKFHYQPGTPRPALAQNAADTWGVPQFQEILTKIHCKVYDTKLADILPFRLRDFSQGQSKFAEDGRLVFEDVGYVKKILFDVIGPRGEKLIDRENDFLYKYLSEDLQHVYVGVEAHFAKLIDILVEGSRANFMSLPRRFNAENCIARYQMFYEAALRFIEKNGEINAPFSLDAARYLRNAITDIGDRSFFTVLEVNTISSITNPIERRAILVDFLIHAQGFQSVKSYEKKQLYLSSDLLENNLYSFNDYLNCFAKLSFAIFFFIVIFLIFCFLTVFSAKQEFLSFFREINNFFAKTTFTYVKSLKSRFYALKTILSRCFFYFTK